MGYDGLSSATTAFDHPTQTVLALQDTASSATAEPQAGPSSNFAGAWLADFRRAVENGPLPWRAPHVAGSDDEISFEWWKDSRNLTVFVRGYSVEVLKTWGTNIHNDMETRIILNADDAVAVWRWLRGE